MSETPSVEGRQVRLIPGPESWQQMMGIVRRMRKIPELPSEVPKDSSQLLGVEFPEEGGIHTFMTGQDEPYKGFPFHEMVDKIDLTKKVIRSVLSSFFHSIKRRNKLQLATIALVPWFLKDLAQAGIYTFFRFVERFEIKDEMYSTSMRELLRALSIEFHGEKEHERELRRQFKILVCMILEFDNAYRFRFQDIIGELDKVALKKSPADELTRLLTLMQSREKGQSVADTWELFKTFLKPALFVNPGLKRTIVETLSELDLDKIRLSKEDKSYCAPRSDYTFGFQLHPTESDLEIIGKVKRKKESEERQTKVRDESTKAHEALFVRQKEEMVVSPELEAQIVRETNEFLLQCNTEMNQKFEEGRKAILRKHLSEEQLSLVDKHQREREEMDNKYNVLLKEAEK